MLAHVYPQKAKSFSTRVGLQLCVLLSLASAQQALGGNTGTVSDLSGGTIVDAQVTLVANATKRTRTQRTSSSGSYNFVSLPIDGR